MKNLIFVGLILFSFNSFALNNFLFPGDTIFKKGNGYIVRVTKPGTVNIAVHAMVNGQRRLLGTMPFRVKRVPDPIAKVGGVNSGKISQTELRAQSRIDAVIENFDFEFNYKVSKFVVSTTYKGFEISEECRGNNFNDKVKDILKKAQRGNKVYFDNIKAIGSDGSTRNIGSVILKVI